MNNVDLVDLDPEIQTRLEQLLTRSGSLHRPAAILPDTGEILRYLCGALGPGEARALERGMNASADARRRLRDAHSALARLQTMSWHEVTHEAAHDPTADAWRRIAAERAQVLAQTSLPGRAADWTGICKRAAEGLAEAQAALTRLRALGEHLTGMWLGTTELAAETRGPRPPLLTVDGLPVGPSSSLDLTAVIDADGALVARLQFRAHALPPDIDISGRSADLTLYSAGSTLVVGSSIAAEQSIEWRIAGLGTVLGLSAGPLPPEEFCISIGDPAPTEFESESGLFLMGAVIEPSGEPTPGGVLFPLREPPVWDSGRVRITLDLGGVFWRARIDYRLALDVNIFMHRWQRLGSWPINELQAGVNRLTAPFSDESEFGGAFDLPLRIQLLPPSP